jgi:hypothetical protein
LHNLAAIENLPGGYDPILVLLDQHADRGNLIAGGSGHKTGYISRSMEILGSANNDFSRKRSESDRRGPPVVSAGREHESSQKRQQDLAAGITGGMKKCARQGRLHVLDGVNWSRNVIRIGMTIHVNGFNDIKKLSN